MQPIEWIGVLSGVSYVVLAIRQNLFCWPIGLINVGVYTFIFFQARLYADMGLQLIYAGLTFYGWYHWWRGGSNQKESLAISHLPKHHLPGYFALAIGATLLIGFGLSKYTNADIAYIDSLTTVLSLIAQYWVARKYLENWLLWIVANTLFVGVYFYKALYLTSGLYFLFLVLAVIGFRQWKKELYEPSKKSPL